MSDGRLLLSIDYWLAFAVYAIAERALLGVLPPRVHYAATTAATAAFLLFFTDIGAIHLAALFGSLTLVYVGIVGMPGPEGKEEDRKTMRPFAITGVVLLLWSLGKVGTALRLDALTWLFFLGASFLLVKVWSFAKDIADGRVERPDLFCFLSYCTYFPCFISGPMHFYGEFQKTFESRASLDGRVVVDSVWRVLHGLVKVLVLARLLRPFSLEPLAELGWSQVTAAELSWRAVVYSLVIYLDFSGYSDIVIASSRFVGITVPENFRLPYFSRNIRDFWQRWHMTFTRFLTQYIFVPFTRRVQRTRPKVSAERLAVASYFVTFTFCGFWHGSRLNFVAWGVYHAVGLAVYDVFRRRRMAAARAARKPLSKPARWTHPIFAALTFLFVSAGWVFFVLPMSFWSR